MKPYQTPQAKTLKAEQKTPLMQTSIGIHREMGYPEDAANSSIFNR